ncbi:MAG: cobalamin-dependent protein [Thermoanaerobaculia bacterium]
MAKILFLTAPYHCGVVEVAGRWPPLTFGYLATSAKEAGFKPLLYDAMSTGGGLKDIKKVIEEVKPDIVGLSSITSTIEENLKIAKIVKNLNKNIKIILGGVHPSFMFKEILENNEEIDYIVIGEGEETLKELLSKLKKDEDISNVKGIAFKEKDKIISGKRNFLEDLDPLTPSFEIFQWENYRYFPLKNSRLGAISTSRGCPHSCTFCSQQKFWEKNWRGRSPEKVLDEIKLLYKNYGARVILITDEYPTKDRQRWEELLKGIISLKFKDLYFLMETRVDDILRDEKILKLYKEAGIIHIYIGLEAGTQETLDLIKKETDVQMGKIALDLLHSQGFITETSFVMGLPEEDKKSAKRTLELAKYYNPDFAHFLCITPWPYSDLYEEVKDFIRVFDYSKYNLIEPIIEPKKLKLKEVDEIILKCYRDYYIWKFKNLEKNGFKYNYIIESFKLIMKSSFIKNKILKYPDFKRKIFKQFYGFKN